MDSTQLAKILQYFGMDKDAVAKVGVRNPAIGSYNDTFYQIINGKITKFQGNTDPSRQAPGRATLKANSPARWRAGVHGLSHPAGPRRYPAFVQASECTVTRYGQGDDTGWFGINHHHGSASGSTSSLGCQTYPYDIWSEAREGLYEALGVTVKQIARDGVAGKSFPYVVVKSSDIESIVNAWDNGEAHKGVVREKQAPPWGVSVNGKMFSQSKNIAGALYVPARAFVSAATGNPLAGAKLVKWKDLPGDEDAIMVSGVSMGEIYEDKTGAWVKATSALNALNIKYSRDEDKRLLVVGK